MILRALVPRLKPLAAVDQLLELIRGRSWVKRQRGGDLIVDLW
jgi:hypothetical protein